MSDAEPPADESFIPIREVLAGIFEDLERRRLDWYDELEREWENLLGDITSGHARPAGLRGKTLIVHADSSAWLNELVRFRRAEMLARIQKKFGAERVKSISLKLGSGSA